MSIKFNGKLIAGIPDVSNKQDTLVSGENIKTINNESILGEGNFDVSSIEPLSQEEYDRRRKAGELEEGKYYSTPSDVSLEILATLYPVGSLYITTNNTCPLASLGIGTWILEATKILVDIEDTAPVAGNGLSIGLTDSVNNQTILVDTNWNYLASIGDYGKPTGSDTGGGSIRRGSIGVTTDATKSGMEANINSTNLPCNIFRRIA